MNRVKKQISSLLLCMALIFALLPTAPARAAGHAFIVEGDPAGYTYDANGALTYPCVLSAKPWVRQWNMWNMMK
jgi:hypothetical protein